MRSRPPGERRPTTSSGARPLSSASWSPGWPDDHLAGHPIGGETLRLGHTFRASATAASPSTAENLRGRAPHPTLPLIGVSSSTTFTTHRSAPDRLGGPHRVTNGAKAVLRSIHTHQNPGPLCDLIRLAFAHDSTILRSTPGRQPFRHVRAGAEGPADLAGVTAWRTGRHLGGACKNERCPDSSRPAPTHG